MFGNYYGMGGYPSYYPMNGAMPDNLGQLRNQQMQSPIPQPQVPAQPQSDNGLTWVQGIEGAKSWYVAPGKSVLLMDSEAQVFYIKTVDASGMPAPLRIFEYKETQAEPPTAKAPDLSNFVTKKELEEAIASIKGGINYAEPVISNVE